PGLGAHGHLAGDVRGPASARRLLPLALRARAVAAAESIVLSEQTLDRPDFFGIEMEIEDRQIGPHVLGVGGPGERQHADVHSETEDDLAWAAAVMPGD